MKLGQGQQRRAEDFVCSAARPHERALYVLHFHGGSKDDVRTALRAFQNSDGGFGHGLEPAVFMPDSSAICTVRGMQILIAIGASPDDPLVCGAVDYLLRTFDSKSLAWEIVPARVNDSPHAPWWHYDAEKQAATWGSYLINPRVEIAAVLFAFSAAVPPEFLRRISELVLAHLDSQPPPPDNMHDIACYLNLVETAAVPARVRDRVLNKLRPGVLAAVERDPAKWHTYCLRPAGYMGVMRSPSSPFAAALADEVDVYLDFEIAQQRPDGSWHPTWSWGSAYADAWPQAKLGWQGIITLHNLRMLASFDLTVNSI